MGKLFYSAKNQPILTGYHENQISLKINPISFSLLTSAA